MSLCSRGVYLIGSHVKVYRGIGKGLRGNVQLFGNIQLGMCDPLGMSTWVGFPFMGAFPHGEMMSQAQLLEYVGGLIVSIETDAFKRSW